MTFPANTTVAIIGAGLAGLHAGRLLHRARIRIQILEARDRLGGRVLSVDPVGQEKVDGFDLGPSWFWPDQHPAMAALIKELRLNAFPQHGEGDLFVERRLGQAPDRFRSFQQEPRPMRLAGGTGAMVHALAAELPPECIRCGARVTALELQGEAVRLVLADGKPLIAEHVIAALPPRLLEATVAVRPEVDAATRRRWRATATWMAPHAKFFALYDRPFWREDGLSGMAQSAVGPLAEVHDANTSAGAAALFGFIGIDAHQRATAGIDRLSRACLDQLVRLFGTQAWRPRRTLLQDWAAEELTATAEDRQAGQHPLPQRGPWVGGAWAAYIHLAGSETSPIAPGYLAGALDAAERAVAATLSRLAPAGGEDWKPWAAPSLGVHA